MNLTRSRYSTIENTATVARKAEAMEIQRDLFSTIPSRAIPAIATTAVLRCIEGRPGETLISKTEWTAHPISTADPSRMARAPQSPPIRLGHDKLGQEVPGAVAWTGGRSLPSYRPMQNNALRFAHPNRLQPLQADPAASQRQVRSFLEPILDGGVADEPPSVRLG